MAGAVGYSHRIWLLILFLVTAQSTAAQQTTNDLTELTVDAFNIQTELCRIHGSKSVLINSTLYIDGGDVVVERCNTGSQNCSTWAEVNNYLIAIPFEQPLSAVDWASLPYQATNKPKNVPLTTRGILWRNKEGTALYKFGGTIIGNTTSLNYNNDTVAPTRIWKYETGLSTWSSVSPSLSNNWDLEHCSVLSLDKSFAYGGWSGNSGSSLMTLDSAQSPEASSRLSTFNPAGVYEGGAMLHIPIQGGDGLLLFIGGSVTLATGAVQGNPDVPMSSVRLYDIANDTWYEQSTSTDAPNGIFPNPRHGFCAVMASTGPETFDIFMYGGDFNMVESSYSTGLWILSIPSFRWFYFEDPDTRTRLSGVTCQVIGPHFLRFGGWNYYSPTQVKGPTCMNSLSIFNLNTFNWTDTFDPTDTTYKSPTKVEVWNANNSSPVSGWDTGVQSLFATLNSTATPAASPTTSTSPTSSSGSEPSSSSTLPTVLGSVLGSLVVIGLLLAGILFLVKRKKNKQKELEKRFELAGEVRKTAVELPTDQAPSELPGVAGFFAGGHPVDVKARGVGRPEVSEVR